MNPPKVPTIYRSTEWEKVSFWMTWGFYDNVGICFSISSTKAICYYRILKNIYIILRDALCLWKWDVLGWPIRSHPAQRVIAHSNKPTRARSILGPLPEITISLRNQEVIEDKLFHVLDIYILFLLHVNLWTLWERISMYLLHEMIMELLEGWP